MHTLIHATLRIEVLFVVEDERVTSVPHLSILHVEITELKIVHLLSDLEYSDDSLDVRR